MWAIEGALKKRGCLEPVSGGKPEGSHKKSTERAHLRMLVGI